MSVAPTGKHWLVVARWNEDLSWLDYLPEPWRPRVIYKGVDLPNEGRESSSYFHALATLDYKPEDTLAFVQGDPFAHSHHFFERLEGPCDGFTWLGDWLIADDHNGAPHHLSRLPLAARCVQWLGVTPPDMFHFAAGAQFMIPGVNALKHSKDFYRNMVDVVNADEHGPWIMERLWATLLG